MTVISETQVPYFHPVTMTIAIFIAPKRCNQLKIIISSPEVENPNLCIIFYNSYQTLKAYSQIMS